MPEKKRVSKRVWRDRDDAPEGSEAQFARAEFAIAGTVLQPAQGTLARRRGRPKKPNAKLHIHIRLSPQVLGYFRATGPGWQTPIDNVLRQWVSRRRKPSPAGGKHKRAA